MYWQPLKNVPFSVYF